MRSRAASSVAEPSGKPGTFRRAVPEDAPILREITEAAYAVYVPRIGHRPPPMETDFDAHIAAGEARVVEVDGGIAGYLLLKPNDGQMLVINIALHPEMQGRGLGKQILRHAELEAREQGCREMALYTHIKMTENRALYARFGYTEVEERAEEGVERVYMIKALAPEEPQ